MAPDPKTFKLNIRNMSDEGRVGGDRGAWAAAVGRRVGDGEDGSAGRVWGDDGNFENLRV
jgi:hypothetical protein